MFHKVVAFEVALEEDRTESVYREEGPARANHRVRKQLD